MGLFDFLGHREAPSGPILLRLSLQLRLNLLVVVDPGPISCPNCLRT